MTDTKNIMLTFIILAGWLILLSTCDRLTPTYAAECSLAQSADPDWQATGRVVEVAVQNHRVYVVADLDKYGVCMLELNPGLKVPVHGTKVGLFGMILGIPGSTPLRLVIMDYEERA